MTEKEMVSAKEVSEREPGRRRNLHSTVVSLNGRKFAVAAGGEGGSAFPAPPTPRRRRGCWTDVMISYSLDGHRIPRV